VLNALKLPWSKSGPFRPRGPFYGPWKGHLGLGYGPVEGNIQRFKLIKRQAYGRANLDLLKTRVMQPV